MLQLLLSWRKVGVLAEAGEAAGAPMLNAYVRVNARTAPSDKMNARSKKY